MTSFASTSGTVGTTVTVVLPSSCLLLFEFEFVVAQLDRVIRICSSPYADAPLALSLPLNRFIPLAIAPMPLNKSIMPFWLSPPAPARALLDEDPAAPPPFTDRYRRLSCMPLEFVIVGLKNPVGFSRMSSPMSLHRWLRFVYSKPPLITENAPPLPRPRDITCELRRSRPPGSCGWCVRPPENRVVPLEPPSLVLRRARCSVDSRNERRRDSRLVVMDTVEEVLSRPESNMRLSKRGI
mmetsp:Transcript_2178/g.5104  ORF Transcript_2178/g.5104 Transcript_2178/m.5104 type:complete len:239 (-) Transcript_2178:1156-1872(-)